MMKVGSVYKCKSLLPFFVVTAAVTCLGVTTLHSQKQIEVRKNCPSWSIWDIRGLKHCVSLKACPQGLPKSSSLKNYLLMLYEPSGIRDSNPYQKT